MTDNSQDPISAISKEGENSHNSRKMPAKPTFKKKLNSRTEASALSSHNYERES